VFSCNFKKNDLKDISVNYKDKDVFAFASEQKALLSLRKFGLIETGINEKAVFDYFIHSQIEYEEEGMFKNIFELMPSQHITLDVSSLESNIEKYYTLQAEHKYFKYDAEKNKYFSQQLKTVFF
jgi:asparagine synthetase B (glutamine-hydrolysing)